MSTLKVSIVQANIKWHDPEHNLKHYNDLISSIVDADLIVLPEMWSTGYTMKAHHFHDYQNPAIDQMKSWSLAKNATVAGSLIYKEGERYFNRMYIAQGGKIECSYDKKHLFAYAGEERIFSQGEKSMRFNIKDWKVNPNICYDLRFPVWLRNHDDYDLLLVSANWPTPRITAWSTLLRARAIENQCFVIGANCVGIDAWKNNYSGCSAIIAYDGETRSELKNEEGIVSAELDRQMMLDFRKKLPFLNDKDAFELT